MLFSFWIFDLTRSVTLLVTFSCAVTLRLTTSPAVETTPPEKFANESTTLVTAAATSGEKEIFCWPPA